MIQFNSHETNNEGYTHTIRVDGKNIISKWGFEFSDGDSFFIQNQKTNSSYRIVNVHHAKNETRAEYVVKLRTAEINIVMEEKFSPKKITRKYYFTPLQNVKLTDIAVSQAFPQDLFFSMKIDNKEVPFDKTERNHQYESGRSILRGEKYDLIIDFKSNCPIAGFVPVMYGRSSPAKGWVVHSRLFPKQMAQKVIVWCHEWWNKRIPFSSILTRVDPLVDYLWYVGEKPTLTKRRTFGFSAFGLVDIPKNTCIEMTETLTLKPRAKKK